MKGGGSQSYNQQTDVSYSDDINFFKVYIIIYYINTHTLYHWWKYLTFTLDLKDS